MKGHRLRAPSTDGALLAVPPLGDVVATPDDAGRLAGWQHDFQGRTAEHLRQLARNEVVAESRRFLKSHGLDLPARLGTADQPAALPLIVTGHQPELFHPGVWVKNFATSAIAEARGGLGLNLIIDNDLPKSSSIRVPRLVPAPARSIRVEFDAWHGEAPYEDFQVRDEGLFADFGRRAREALGDLVADPIVADFWPRVVARSRPGVPLGLRLALARRELEASWGVSNLEVPLSNVCQGDAFLWFASHILAHLPRFQEIHNAALAEYRARYGIRSKNHPVAALATRGEWREAPFWVWRKGGSNRSPLLIRQGPREMQLRIAGEDQPFVELPLAPDREACCAVERLRELASRSIRLRTRALTTTMFSRLLLGDLFIHGIGGAKYDELGDVITGRFFRVEPPLFLTLSLTQFLGIPEKPVSNSTLASTNKTLRDLSFNPERYLTEPMGDETRRIIGEKAAEIALVPATRRGRVARFRRIRLLNNALQSAVHESRTRMERLRDGVIDDLRWNAIARGREYAAILHSSARLRSVMAGLREKVLVLTRGSKGEP